MNILKMLERLFQGPKREAEMPQPSSALLETTHDNTLHFSSTNLEHMKKTDKLRYPIGDFEYGKTYSLAQTRENIVAIERLPNELKKVLRKIGRANFDLSYRPGGWTVRQVVHHLADSHMNAFIRMKMALTEPTPVIKPYEQDLWAETADVVGMPIKVSLRLLAALHRRWVALLESLSEEDLEKGYFHPERNAIVFLPEAIALYAWHGKHHLAHLSIVAQNVSEHKTGKHHAAPDLSKTQKEATTEGQKLSRAEILAKARAARAAKIAQRKSEEAPTTKTKKEAKTEGQKLSRAEALAKARAARAAKIAQRKPEEAPTTKTKEATTEGQKLSRAEILAKARAARAAKIAQRKSEEVPTAKAKKEAKTEGPKLSRAEILAKARAARAAKIAQRKPEEMTTTKAKKEAKTEGQKLSRAEILAKARAARAAKIAQRKPEEAPTTKTKEATTEGQKLSRAEILAKARAARAAKIAQRKGTGN